MKKYKISPKQKPEVVDLSDNKTKYLVGWPGYRNAEGRSGLGYIETQAEWAHMRGLFLRWLATGKFKTRNPFYLVFIALLGIILSSPILLLFAGEEGRLGFIRGITVFGPYTVAGVLMVINVILSLIGCSEEESITGD